MTGDHQLLDFYTGVATDDRGRYLRDILEWPDEELESVHDYIQWLFPLDQPSAFNRSAPLLSDATIQEFRRSPLLHRDVLHSLERMLRFYGFELASGEGCEIGRAKNFTERARVWLTPMNHNHLRMTRILKCLNLVGLEGHARALFDALDTIYNIERCKPRPAITAETFHFWQDATSPR
jgi:hypothetical protein